jgi:chloramphenicol 3-O phosphotransferase
VAESGSDIVLDLVLRHEAELQACLDGLGSRPTFVFGIWSPLEVLEEREHARPDRGGGMARSQFDHPAYSRPYAMKIDTSLVSPAQGARMIRAFINTPSEPS